ncbi:MAG: hypothetical protein AAGI44_02345 [Pseudomonadota bacterium]
MPTAQERKQQEEAVDALIQQGTDSGTPADPNAGEPTPDQSQQAASAEPGTPDPSTQGGETPGEEKSIPDEEQTYKKRFEVLQGKYNAEVPRLNARIKQLEESQGDPAEVQRLRAEIQTLTQQLAQAHTASTTSQLEISPDATLADLEDEYGEKFVNGLKSLIRKEMAGTTERVDNVESQVQGDAKARFLSAMRQTLQAQDIDFDSYNNGADFLAWLQEPVSDLDPGRTRQAALNEAANSHDVTKASKFFVEYRQSLGASAEDSKGGPLSQHVQPGSDGGQAQPGAPASGWDPVAFKELGRKLTAGEITLDEFQAEEQRMYAALTAQNSQPG